MKHTVEWANAARRIPPPNKDRFWCDQSAPAPWYVFVGERRSQRAIRLGVRWEDGRLAARTLHAALRAAQTALAQAGIPHLRLIHPAARGAIRARGVYHAHVAAVLARGQRTTHLDTPACGGRIPPGLEVNEWRC